LSRAYSTVIASHCFLLTLAKEIVYKYENLTLLVGRIRALGRIRGSIVHQIFPITRNFPDVLGACSQARGDRHRARLRTPLASGPSS